MVVNNGTGGGQLSMVKDDGGGQWLTMIVVIDNS